MNSTQTCLSQRVWHARVIYDFQVENTRGSMPYKLRMKYLGGYAHSYNGPCLEIRQRNDVPLDESPLNFGRQRVPSDSYTGLALYRIAETSRWPGSRIFVWPSDDEFQTGLIICYWTDLGEYLWGHSPL